MEAPPLAERMSQGLSRSATTILASAACMGLASLLLMPIELVMPLGDTPPWVVRGIALVQPATLTALALVIGNRLAPRVGLGAPLLSSEVRLSDPGFIRALQAAAGCALAAGVLIAGYEWGLTVVPAGGAVAPLIDTGALSPPLASRVLYSGFTEEVIARWGFMTFVVWFIRRWGSCTAWPRDGVYWAAAFVASLVFAAAHLPLVHLLVSEPPAQLLAAVLGLNTMIGVSLGWLYWRFGMEAAMAAHASAHLIAGLIGWALCT
jgi:hypothetical protein